MATQAVNLNPTNDLSILSLDAGGPQGISQLMILNNVMELVTRSSGGDFEEAIKRPCEVFHAIGGVGTGGLIAILLVILKMTAVQAMEEFNDLVGLVFTEVAVDPKKQTEKLSCAITGILERYGVDESAKLTPSDQSSPACKLIVPIMYKNHVGIPCVLRNYIAGHEPPTSFTIAEAMLAACATPPIFSSMSIEKDFANFEYIGGDIGLSNPTREIIAEAHRTFGDDATVTCLLSIGCGHSGIKKAIADPRAATWIDFLGQVMTDSEKTAGEMAARMKHLTLYHRLSVEHGLDSLKPNAWRGPETIAAHTAVYLGDIEVAERVKCCADTISHGDGFTTLEQLRHSGGRKVLSPAMPPLATHYVERKEAMTFIENALYDQNGTIKPGSKAIVVTGIGGCGKTQLIRKFVEQHGSKFLTVFFVDGSSKGSFERDLVRHVRSLGTAHSQKTFDESMIFLSQPVSGNERILVIDNVDDPTVELAPLLPRWPNGTVVVTSRDRSRGQLGSSHLELDVMSQDESIELLVRGSGKAWPPSEQDREDAIAVAKELGFHPISLVQGISYMSNTGYSARTYINRLRRYREPLLNDPAKNQVEMRYKTEFAAFDASYEILPLQTQKTLHLLSFFHWKNICLELISLAAEHEFARGYCGFLPHRDEFRRGKECLESIFCTSGKWSPLELDSLIASLRNHSLITVTYTDEVTVLQMHPLVHEWARSRIPGNELENFRAAAIRLLCCGAIEDNHSMMKYLSSHVQALSPAWDRLHVNDTLSFAFILAESGLYKDAVKLMETGYQILKFRLGENHFDTTEASTKLAGIYNTLGRYADAEKLDKEALERREVLLGADHHDTLVASGNLAATYSELGRYREAEELEKEVLRRRREILGMDHLDTLIAAANLATTYLDLGRYSEAEELEKDVLHRRKAQQGVDHPDTILASANLAATYRELGRYVEAEELEKDVLRRRIALHGVDHVDTIVASASLACTYRGLGRYTEAEEIEIEVLRRGRELAGDDHPYTILAAEHLACTYRHQGRYTEAEELERDILMRRTVILGELHPHTLRAMYNLARTCEAMQRLPEAIELASEAVQMISETLGETHPLYIKTSSLLADLIKASLVRQWGRDRLLANLRSFPLLVYRSLSEVQLIDVICLYVLSAIVDYVLL